MKKITTIAAVFAAFIAAAACSSNSNKTAAISGADSTATAVKSSNPKDFMPRKSEIDSVSYLIGVNFGSFIKGYDFGENLNYALLKKGITDFLQAEGDYSDPEFAKQFKIDPQAINEVFNSYLAKRRDYKSALNKQKEADFLAANAKKDSVETSASGLQYIIRNAGNDVKPGAADTVFVNYKGTRLDGTVFDQANSPEGVRMLLNRVIKGWTEGLQLIGEGGSVRLFVPAELAYGEQGNRGIEPNSTLIFDVDLIKVSKVAETEAE